ncbi:MAG: hypothetical protein LUI39_10405 [Lachnospiraceae bacterium]|nr:hypothetical protein [Lachnospiraceae bacterium]
MSNVKERILGAVTIMSENDAQKIWELIQATFQLANAETVKADEDELAAFNAFHDGEPEYQPSITQEELIRELGL